MTEKHRVFPNGQWKRLAYKVENMSEEEMNTFLEEQKKKYLKARADQLKQNCEAIEKASKNGKLEWFSILCKPAIISISLNMLGLAQEGLGFATLMRLFSWAKREL